MFRACYLWHVAAFHNLRCPNCCAPMNYFWRSTQCDKIYSTFDFLRYFYACASATCILIYIFWVSTKSATIVAQAWRTRQGTLCPVWSRTMGLPVGRVGWKSGGQRRSAVRLLDRWGLHGEVAVHVCGNIAGTAGCDVPNAQVHELSVQAQCCS